MDPLSVLCLYSQYSPNSDRFIAKLKKYAIDFIQLIPLDTVYSRKIVSSKIKSVPAIVIQYPNSLEIYEGTEALDWLDEVIQNKQKDDMQKEMLQRLEQQKIQSELPPPLPSQPQPPPPSPVQPSSQSPPPPPPTPSVQVTPQQSSSTDKYTPIDDVVTIEDSQNRESQTQQKLSASSKKTQDLLARARELEKGREDMSGKKPPFPSPQ